MPHAPLRRIVSGADAAVLLIHGILGTPDHFAPLLPCIPENWSFETLLLAGHGGSVRDFSAARMADWKQQVHQALARLRAAHRHVYLAAHSMGTLFALQEAAQSPVAGLFLLNVPLRLQLKPRLLQTVTRIYRGKISPGDAWTQAALAGYSIGPDPNPLHYLGWVPRYLSLFAEIRATRQVLPRVTSPGLAYLSQHDEMVSLASARCLAQCPHLETRTLPDSGHFYYTPQDLETLQQAFSALLTASEA